MFRTDCTGYLHIAQQHWILYKLITRKLTPLTRPTYVRLDGSPAPCIASTNSIHTFQYITDDLPIVGPNDALLWSSIHCWHTVNMVLRESVLERYCGSPNKTNHISHHRSCEHGSFLGVDRRNLKKTPSIISAAVQNFGILKALLTVWAVFEPLYTSSNIEGRPIEATQGTDLRLQYTR